MLGKVTQIVVDSLQVKMASLPEDASANGLEDEPRSTSAEEILPLNSGLTAMVEEVGGHRIAATAPAICCTASGDSAPTREVEVSEELIMTVVLGGMTELGTNIEVTEG